MTRLSGKMARIELSKGKNHSDRALFSFLFYASLRSSGHRIFFRSVIHSFCLLIFECWLCSWYQILRDEILLMSNEDSTYYIINVLDSTFRILIYRILYHPFSVEIQKKTWLCFWHFHCSRIKIWRTRQRDGKRECITHSDWIFWLRSTKSIIVRSHTVTEMICSHTIHIQHESYCWNGGTLLVAKETHGIITKFSNSYP